jgi:2-pyrone-4,6-dicarboxylate lactonase
MNVQPSFLAKRRKPTFKLPPGTTDAHCHVFGPVNVFPYAPNRHYTPDDAPRKCCARCMTISASSAP